MTIFWHIARQLFLTTVAVSGGITFLVWLSQSLRFLNIITMRHARLWDFFSMTLFLVPDLLGLSLPFAFFISVLWVYKKMLLDHELSIMKTSGMSDVLLLRPVMGVAGGVAFFLFILNLWILPLSFQHFRKLEVHFRNHFTTQMVREGEFNTLGPVVIYAQKRSLGGKLTGLFIYDAHDKKHPVTLTAKSGAILEAGDGVQLILSQGARQEGARGSKRHNTLMFDRYVVKLSPQSPLKRPRKPHEMFVNELLFPDQNLSYVEKSARRIEGIQRLFVPFYVFCFGALAGLFCIRGLSFSREGRSLWHIALLVLCFSCEGVGFFLLHSTRLSGVMLLSILGVMLLPLLLWFLIWRQDLSEERGALPPLWR